jgi:tetratricopeptide (TPR) repeat protein
MFFERHNKSGDKSLQGNDFFLDGMTFIAEEQYSKAIEAFTSALSRDPNNALSYLERGAVYGLMNQFEKSIEDLNMAISLMPDEAKFYTFRGSTYNQLGNTEKAFLDFKKGSELGDKNADEFLKKYNNGQRAKKAFSLEMNKNLWRDTKFFDVFIGGAAVFHKLLSEGQKSPDAFVTVANMFDDLMQDYEKEYGPIEDPIFFWYFSTVNGLALRANNDEVGRTRMRYLVNGYKEGLMKHLLYPSYQAFMIDTAVKNIEEFANDQDKAWLSMNINKFTPLPE